MEGVSELVHKYSGATTTQASHALAGDAKGPAQLVGNKGIEQNNKEEGRIRCEERRLSAQ